jgi:Xaa-Pro aminopeptidase
MRRHKKCRQESKAMAANQIQNLHIYAQRRARLAEQLSMDAGSSAVAVIPTAPERSRNRDSDFPYRHDSYFYYLTGFTEPNAWLVLTAQGQSMLFCQPKDLEREIWDGYRLGPESAVHFLGVDEAYSCAELTQRMPKLMENVATVWYPFATHEGLEVQIEAWLRTVRSRVRFGVECAQQLRDVCGLLDEMRLIKDSHELSIMRRAAKISAQGHIRAMQTSARMLRAKQDVREFHLEAELLHEFRQNGAQFPAYTSIVAAGANACVLHYRADTAALRPGELVLIDAGCELDGYASDITRTFPADGQFTAEQKAIYELVLASQEAAIAATKAGAKFTDPHDATVRVLAQGLLDLGLLSHDKDGFVDDVIEKRAYFKYYMHRTSHWLGMDVHDCGSYIEPSDVKTSSVRRDPISGETILNRPSRILREGMVLTIEPGVYIRPAADVPEKFWNIGVRIEDDAVVGSSGCELLTRHVPVTVSEIEALMR